MEREVKKRRVTQDNEEVAWCSQRLWKVVETKEPEEEK